MGITRPLSVLYPPIQRPLISRTYQQPRAAHSMSQSSPSLHTLPTLSLVMGRKQRVQARVEQLAGSSLSSPVPQFP